ncbi:4-hydroxyphenylpyruvate dioxygenase [Streptomyces humi]
MTNPFEDTDAEYVVLVNEEAQYSLWPVFAAVPDGWTVALPATTRQQALDFVEAQWTDMRPRSLALRMAQDARDAAGGADAPAALTLSHTELYVADLDRAVAEFSEGYGFAAFADAESRGPGGAARSVALRQGGIVLVLTQALDEVHPAASFVARHGDGVADIALVSPDVRAAFAEAVRRSAGVLAEPAERDGYVTAVLEGGFTDVRHTLVQRPLDTDGFGLPGFTERPDAAAPDGDLTVLDHVAVTVEAGRLAPATAYYERVFGYHGVYEELMVQGREAMDSRAVRSPAGDVTFTVLAPSADHDPGHIGDFLERHGGGGVHHLAFATGDIIGSVARLRASGVEFLPTPDRYYDAMSERIQLLRHTPEALRAARILADEDHDGQLYQIFTRSTHPRRTLFFEIIERAGADSFGGGNVRALYEAVQAEKAASLVGSAR